MSLASTITRLIRLVPRPVLIALAKAALERVETYLEARASSDATRRAEVTAFASVYSILDSLV